MIRSIFFTASLFCLFSLWAVPAPPYPIVYTQPDGAQVSIYQRGDENVSWMESLDGYTILRDKKNFLCYAQKNKKGELVPSSYRATEKEIRSTQVQAFLSKIEPGLFYTPSQIEAKKSARAPEEVLSQKKNDTKLSPSVKAICVLVAFPGKEFSISKSRFDSLFNMEGYDQDDAQGSVRDYFKTVSYGQLDYQTTVIGPYKAPKPEGYYAGTSGTDNAQELATWLLYEADKDIDFSEYDANGDGVVDAFHFIFAGSGKEVTSNRDEIWSHKSIFAGTLNTVDGKEARNYSCSSEFRGRNKKVTHIGVICHEMIHGLGAPDFYDTDYAEGGQYPAMGVWDVMSSGSWNYNGAIPASVNMLQKILFGWVKPTLLTKDTLVSDMPASATHPVAYQIDNFDGSSYVIENKQKQGLDIGCPDSGLFIIRVLPTFYGRKGFNNTHPCAVTPVCASSEEVRPSKNPESYGEINVEGNTTFPHKSKNSFSDITLPSTHYVVSGDSCFKGIYDIIHTEGKTGFRFATEASYCPVYYKLPESPDVSILKIYTENPIENGERLEKGSSIYTKHDTEADLRIDSIIINNLSRVANRLGEDRIGINDSTHISFSVRNNTYKINYTTDTTDYRLKVWLGDTWIEPNTNVRKGSLLRLDLEIKDTLRQAFHQFIISKRKYNMDTIRVSRFDLDIEVELKAVAIEDSKLAQDIRHSIEGNQVNVYFTSATTRRISIFNTLGQSVHQGSANSTEWAVSLPKGQFYIMRIDEKGKEIKSIKFAL